MVVGIVAISAALATKSASEIAGSIAGGSYDLIEKAWGTND